MLFFSKERFVMNPETLIGIGIFTWNKKERVSNRYGSFFLSFESYEGEKTKLDLDSFGILNLDLIKDLTNKKVKVTCKVVETRKSSHIGDLFLKIFPTTPELNELVEFDGILNSEIDQDMDSLCFILKPEDNRKELWIDPKKLYRLHDQTVEVYMEKI
jgi:hypothetical protein